MKKNILLILLLMATLCSLAQQDEFGSWILPNYTDVNRLDFPSLQVTGVDPGSYYLDPFVNSAGAFSNSGELLFYTLAEKVYDANNAYIDDFTAPPYMMLHPEVEIIRKPLHQNEFFIIWTGYDYSENDEGYLYYTEVHVNPSTLEITVLQPVFVESTGSMTGIALTEEENGSRQLYFVSSVKGMCVAEVTDQGVSTNYNEIINKYDSVFQSYRNFSGYNLELMETATGVINLAWITLNPMGAVPGYKKIFYAEYDEPNVVAKQVYTLDSFVERMSGIEFSPADENTLYFSGDHSSTGGVYSLNLTTGTSQLLSGSSDYRRTYLQTAADGDIYGMSLDGNYFGRIHFPGGSFSAGVLALQVTTFHTYISTNYYILPEDHTVFKVLSLLIDTTHVSCPGYSDGTAQAVASNGTEPYYYVWKNQYGVTILEGQGPQYSQITNLAEGAYECCVADSDIPPNTVCQYFEITVDPNLFTHSGGFWIPGQSSYSNENFRFETGLKVTGNSTVTLNNCTFQFGKDAKVIIEPGSKIIMDNTTFTHLELCGDMWQGVEVWGNPAQHQYEYAPGLRYQGMLVMENGSVIENAICAVALWKNNDWYSFGGIVQTDDAVFRNNAKSIRALYYTNHNPYTGHETANESKFDYCDFEINQNYLADQVFFKHVDLVHVNGIDFRACNFSVVDIPGVSTWNSGISSYSAGFGVWPVCSTPGQTPCTNYDHCTFNGFYWGIYATSVNNYTFNVNRAVFEHNSYGIEANGVNNFTVLFSDFYIGPNPNEEEECEDDGDYATGFGINANNSTGFAIEENYFTKVTGAPSGNYTGIRIAETQSTDQVYKNYFDGLSYGNYAVGKNWNSIYTDQGLAYYCNENTNNWQDFYVDTLYNDESGIQNPIGGISLPAGNTFSPTATWHFNNKGDYHIGYFYYEPTNGDTNTVFYPNTDKVWKVTREGVYLYENECLSHYGGGGSGGGTGRGLVLSPGEKQEAEQEYNNNLAEYNNVKSLYDYLKDGGNTQLTLSEVETAIPDEMWELRASLLEKSPHLTTEVLKAAADKTDVFPDNVIFEIMAANPDELRKGELIQYLAEKENPLPEYMLTVLRQVMETGFTYKTILTGNMAHYNQVKTRAAYDIIRSILNDTVTDVAELRTWLGKLGGKRADEQVIASYMEEENYSQALSLANALPQTYDYDENELIEHGYYIDMLNLMNTLNQQGITVFELDSTEVSNLVYIAENTKGTASAQAKGILEYAYGYHFCDCINSDSTGYKSSGSFNPGNYGQAFGISLTVKPNPATDWVAFDYSLNDDNASASIKITDITGKPVTVIPVTGRQGQKIWDTRKVSPGVYFYNFNASGANKSGKIIVRK